MARRNWQLSLTALLLTQVVGTALMAQTLVGDGTVTCGQPYVVQSGDTLSRIAQRAYGGSEFYERLLEANSELLGGDPNLVEVGMEIAIPCLDASGEQAEVDIKDAVTAEGPLSAAELDALFGPIALFPDPLLTQVLVAVTYPLDIVKAGRFVEDSAEMSADERSKAASTQDWDPTVRQLAAGFPDLVTRMYENIDWTEQAGEAVLAQTEDVLASVQRLRSAAMDNGYLVDNAAQNVEVTNNTVSIAPAEPGVVYVPVYETEVVYTTPITTPPQYYYDNSVGYDDDDWGDALIAGGIFLGSAIILDEIFDDDDWGGGWDGDRGDIDWDGGDITIDRGDINIDRGGIQTGDINVGSGNIGSGNIDRGDVRIGGDRTNVDGIRGGDRTNIAAPGRDNASRDVARKQIETRKAAGGATAKLPAKKPEVNRPSQKTRSTAERKPSATTRDKPVSKPKTQKRPTTTASKPKPSRNDNAFAKPSRTQSTKQVSRGASSARSSGGRRR